MRSELRVIGRHTPAWVRGKRGEIDLDVLTAQTLTRTRVSVESELARRAIGYAVDDLLSHCNVPRCRRGVQAIEYVARQAVLDVVAGGLQLGVFDLLSTDALLARQGALALDDAGELGDAGELEDLS